MPDALQCWLNEAIIYSDYVLDNLDKIRQYFEKGIKIEKVEISYFRSFDDNKTVIADIKNLNIFN